MVSDFGLSKTEDSGVMATACGTPGSVSEFILLYIAPVLLVSRKRHRISLGNALFQLRCARSPAAETVRKGRGCVVDRRYRLHPALWVSRLLLAISRIMTCHLYSIARNRHIYPYIMAYDIIATSHAPEHCRFFF